MIQQLKDLVRETHIQQALQSAATQADAIGMLMRAGAERGLKFSSEGIAQALRALLSVEQENLSEEELLAVSGGLRCNMSGGIGSPSTNTRMFPECIPYP
jgi:hypothetical protein